MNFLYSDPNSRTPDPDDPGRLWVSLIIIAVIEVIADLALRSPLATSW